MDYNVLAELLAATVRVAAPLLFVALGAVLSESAGTFAVGVEGMMLMGAFSGAVLTFVTKNWALGFLASALSGAALALVVAVATARFRTDHMVTGLAVNILALGLTSYLLRGLFGGKAPVINLPTLDAIRIPWLCNLPVIGHALFEQSLLTYTAFLLVVPMHLFLKKNPGRPHAARGGRESGGSIFRGYKSHSCVNDCHRRLWGVRWHRRRHSFSPRTRNIHRWYDQWPGVYRASRADHRKVATFADDVRMSSVWSGFGIRT